MTLRRAIVASVLLLELSAAAACRRQTPRPPPPAPQDAKPNPKPPDTPSDRNGHVLTGSERLAWDQAVRKDADIRTHEFVLFVDGVRTPLSGLECGADPGVGGYPCSAALPPLPPGQHRLRLAASYVVNGQRQEGPPSGFLFVTKVDGTAPQGGTQGGQGTPAAGAERGAAEAGGSKDTSSKVEVISDRIAAAADLAVTPDGGLLVAERRGRVLAARDGSLAAEPALEIPDVAASGRLGLFSIALHPGFTANRLVYLAYAGRSAQGAVYRIARGREAGGRIRELATLLDAGPVVDGGWAVVRFGPDQKLYVGFGGAPGAPGSYEGRLLRLNDDGTAAADNPKRSPVVSEGHRGLAGLAFTPKGLAVLRRTAGDVSEIAWIAGSSSLAKGTASPVVLKAEGRVAGLAYLPEDPGRGWRETLMLARLDGGVVPFRALGAPPRPGDVVERLARDYGAARAIGAGADGKVYVATANQDLNGGKPVDYLLELTPRR